MLQRGYRPACPSTKVTILHALHTFRMAPRRCLLDVLHALASCHRHNTRPLLGYHAPEHNMCLQHDGLRRLWLWTMDCCDYDCFSHCVSPYGCLMCPAKEWTSWSGWHKMEWDEGTRQCGLLHAEPRFGVEVTLPSQFSWSCLSCLCFTQYSYQPASGEDSSIPGSQCDPVYIQYWVQCRQDPGVGCKGVLLEPPLVVHIVFGEESLQELVHV